MSFGTVKRGLVWTGLEKLAVQGISFAQGVVLAHLLCPADFGLAAMLGVFMGLGGALADSGLGMMLVVNRSDPGKRLKRDVLIWNVVVAVVMYGMLCSAAPWIAAFYRQPILREIMWVMGLGLVVNAASCVPTALLGRAMRFRVLAWANGISVLAGALVAVSLAWLGSGVWAIVGMGLASSAVRTVTVWLMCGFGSDAEAENGNGGSLRALLGGGWKYMASGLIHTVYANLYSLVIGRMLNPTAVGLYNRGYGCVMAAHNFINPTIERVSFLSFAKNCDVRMQRRFLLLNMVALWPGMAVLWIWAPELVRLVFGEQWLASVPYLRILIVGQLFTPFGNIALRVLQSSGRADLILKTDAIKKPLGLLALACGAAFGVAGICWAKVASDFFEAAADAWYVWGRRAEEEGAIDLVYLWYGAKEPPPGVDKCRACDNGELYWSLKSADRFAPWFRKIFVLVNDGTVIPDWLASNPRVEVVEHRQFIEPWALPLYNTAAIEMWLGRVPGLSERFVYGNDDFFFGRRVSPSDFFDERGRIVYRFNSRGKLHEMRGSLYYDMLRYSRRILGSSEERMPHHCFQGCRKSEMDAFWQRYPEEARQSAGQRYRIGEQLCFDAIVLRAVMAGRGVMRPAYRMVRLRRALRLPAYESMYLALGDRNMIGWLTANRPKMFCLNDTERSTDADRAEAAKVLEDIISERMEKEA